MDIEKRVSEAISHFWKTRKSQRENQGKESGQKDYGNRGAATGGKQLDGFIELFHDLLVGAGLPDSSIHAKTKRTLPGYFRPTKDWDLLIVVDSQLFASIEFKSHIGSFGNNFNNRVEEALGSATDLLTAYREGMFSPSQRPWLGWLMLLEDVDKAMFSTRGKYQEPHFTVREEFKEFMDKDKNRYKPVSYSRRYEIFCERLMRELLYDATCLVLANEAAGLKGVYKEPNPELSFRRFAESLEAKAIVRAKRKK